MADFRTKPVVVQAEQFLPGDSVKQGDRVELLGLGFVVNTDPVGPCVLIDIPEGQARVGYGDWIIYQAGVFSRCTHEAFEATYDAVKKAPTRRGKRLQK